MNLPILAPGWVTAALLAALALAAVQDSMQLRISNLLSASVLALAIVAAMLVGPELRLWQNGAVFAALLAVGTLLFARGSLGGGDVKLLAATGLWFDLGGALRFLVSVAIAGGLLAMVVLVIRQVNWSDGARQRAVILRRRGGIPYGVAIAAGAAFAVLTTASPEPARSDPLSAWQPAETPR